jgi:hypothetical protein
MSKRSTQKATSVLAKTVRRGAATFNHHDVVIFKAGDRYKVRPGTAFLPADDQLFFRNLCGEPVTIVLPPFFDPPTLHLSPSAEERSAVTSREHGVYDYAVVVMGAGGGELAEGESGPRVVID